MPELRIGAARPDEPAAQGHRAGPNEAATGMFAVSHAQAETSICVPDVGAEGGPVGVSDVGDEAGDTKKKNLETTIGMLGII